MKKVVLVLLGLSIFALAKSPAEIVKNVCSSCHGYKMDEKCMGVSGIPNQLGEGQILNALVGYKQGTRSEYSMGSTMSEQVSNLSIEELQALAKYIPTLR